MKDQKAIWLKCSNPLGNQMNLIMRMVAGNGRSEGFGILDHIKHETVQDGGKMGAKAGVKLAYKSVFVPIFTSDGHPMLLDRLFRSRR